MINPDLDFELPPGSFPADKETIRESLPMEVQQWRSLYWARHGLPPRSVAEWMADMPKAEFRFPSEISPAQRQA